MSFNGNNWKISDEYPSIDSAELKADVNSAKELIGQIKELNSVIHSRL